MECPFAKRPCSGAKIAIVWGVKEVVVAATGLDGLGWDVLVVVVMEETCWVAVIRVEQVMVLLVLRLLTWVCSVEVL